MKEMNETRVNDAKRVYEAPSSNVVELAPFSHLMQVSQIGGGGGGSFDVKERTLPFDQNPLLF